MKDQEKKLIENLFDRLKNIELNSSERDESADILIKNLVQKQPSSSYYMIQTILIQETAIEKMNTQIEDLKKQVSQLESHEATKKPSFLSGLFATKKSSSPIFSQKNSVRNNDDFTPVAHNTTNSSIPLQPIQQPQNHSTSFLSNALQTATGVAGGMILGNVLMNAFKHTKPEEEIFNTSHSSFDHHSIENDPNHNVHHNTDDSIDHSAHNENFVNHDEESHISSHKNDDYYQCNTEDHVNHVHENEYHDNIDTNDDNFI